MPSKQSIAMEQKWWQVKQAHLVVGKFKYFACIHLQNVHISHTCAIALQTVYCKSHI